MVSKTAQVVANTQKFGKFNRWNMWLAFLCTAQAVLIVLLGTNATVPITAHYLAVDPLATEAAGRQVVDIATRHLFDIHLSWLVAAFLLVAGIAYIAQATFYRIAYEAQINRGLNVARWAGLGLSAGIVMVTLATLSGASELGTLTMLFVSVVLSAILAACTERLIEQNSDKKGMVSHIICGAAVVTYVLPLVVLISSILGAHIFDGTVSATLYGLYGSVILLSAATFVITHFHLLKKRGFGDPVRAEQTYMLLGLASVSILAWQIFIGYLY